MDPQKLRLYIALATTRHFGRAASQCHVSPSTISRNLKYLEEELAVTLMLRDNRSVSLTPEGERFLRFARESLQQWETFQEALHQQSSELRGQLSLYCSVTASYSFLHDLLTQFRERHPGIAIKLHTGDPAPAIARILNGQEDIAIATRPERLPSALEFKLISKSPLLLIGPSDTALINGNTLAGSWREWPVIIPEEGIARERFDHWCRSQKFTPNIYAEVQGNEAIVSMVSLGFGVGLVPEIVLNNSPLRQRVTRLPDQPDLGPFETGICVLRRRLQSPIVSALWAEIH